LVGRDGYTYVPQDLNNVLFWHKKAQHIEFNLFILEGKLMKLRPLQDRILLKPELSESKTASGIIIPDTVQEKTQKAEVVAIGDDKEKIKVSVGQRVIYDKYAGNQVKIDGVEYLIVKAADVIAVIE